MTTNDVITGCSITDEMVAYYVLQQRIDSGPDYVLFDLDLGLRQDNSIENETSLYPEINYILQASIVSDLCSMTHHTQVQPLADLGAQPSERHPLKVHNYSYKYLTKGI